MLLLHPKDPTDEKGIVRKGLVKVILDDAKDSRTNKKNKKAATFKRLKEKTIFYINSDKRKSIMIMDKEHESVVRKFNKDNFNEHQYRSNVW